MLSLMTLWWQHLKSGCGCWNGVAGELAPMIIEELGCEVIPLNCDVDGNFPIITRTLVNQRT